MQRVIPYYIYNESLRNTCFWAITFCAFCVFCVPFSSTKVKIVPQSFGGFGLLLIFVASNSYVPFYQSSVVV